MRSGNASGTISDTSIVAIESRRREQAGGKGAWPMVANFFDDESSYLCHHCQASFGQVMLAARRRGLGAQSSTTRYVSPVWNFMGGSLARLFLICSVC